MIGYQDLFTDGRGGGGFGARTVAPRQPAASRAQATQRSRRFTPTGGQQYSILGQIADRLAAERAARQAQPGYGQPDPVTNYGYSASEGYSYPNGYSQPLVMPHAGGVAPAPAPNPVDSQFAMGGNSMNRLVALAQQQRQQQSMVPQFQQQAAPGSQYPPTQSAVPQSAVPRWSGVQPVQTPMRTESGQPLYALPARSPGDGGPAYVGGRELMRPGPLVEKNSQGGYRLIKDPEYDSFVASRKPSAEEMLQRRKDWNNRQAQIKADRLTNRQQRRGLSSNRQENRERYFGVANSRNRSLIPQVQADTRPSNPGDIPYIGNSGPVPGMNFDVNGVRAGDIMRAVMRSRQIEDPKERKKAMEEAGLDAKMLQKYVDEYLRKPNRFGGLFDGGDPLKEESINQEFAATVDDIGELYPELKKRKTRKEAQDGRKNLPAAGWQSTPGFKMPKPKPSVVPLTPLM